MKNMALGVVALSLLTAGCSAFSDNPSSSSGRTARATATAPIPQGEALYVSQDTVRRIQWALRDQGFYNGPIDGVTGPETRQALAAYQQKQGRSQTAGLDDTTLSNLLNSSQPRSGSSSSDWKR